MATSINVLDSVGATIAVATNDAIVAKLPAALGQTTMLNSTPVVLASDQSALSVTDTRLPVALGTGGGVKIDGSGTALPVSGTVALGAGAAAIGTVAVTGTTAVSAASLPLPTGAALDASLTTTNTELGILTETTPATDTASSGLNGRLQRVAQRITSLIALLPTALGTGGGLKIDGSGTALPVNGTVALGAGAAAIGTVGVTALPAIPTGANVIGGVTVADGSNLVEGGTADAAAAAGGTGSLSAKLRRISTQLPALLGSTTTANSMPVSLPSDLLSATAWTSTSRLPTTELDSLAVSGTQVAAAVLFTQDMSGYESISVQVTSAGTTCTITYETSDDNTNWVIATGQPSAQTGSSNPLGTSTTAILNSFPKRGRYFRARVSTYTSGTVTVVGNVHKTPVSIPGRTTVDLAAGGTHGIAVPTTGLQPLLAGYNVNPAAVTNAQNTRQTSTLLGVAVNKPFSIPEADWSYAPPTGGIVNSTVGVTIQAAAGAGIKGYVTGFTLMWDTLGAATEFVIRNGAAGTVIWRGKIPTAANMMVIPLPTPLQSSANTLLEIATITASVTGGVYFSAQGYLAAD